MNLALWIAQGFVAFAMLAAGGLKLATPRVKLLEKLKWAASWSDTRFKLLGLAEVLGAVGLIVPWLTGIAPILTPAAAVGLGLLQVGAAVFHGRRAEYKQWPVNAVFLALAVFIAAARTAEVVR